jgi:hypothetical protein
MIAEKRKLFFSLLPVVAADFAFHQNMTGRHHSRHAPAHAISLPVLCV